MSTNAVLPGLSPLPNNAPVTDKAGNPTPVFQGWFASIYTWCQGMGQAGVTAARPTAGLFIGRDYFDTTLGYKVTVKQVSPSVIWVNGAGTPV